MMTDRSEINPQPVTQSPLSPIRKGLLKIAGGVALTAGIIGIVLPVWPSTCFFLIALSCFSRSSPRMHSWMVGNRYFGSHLRRYHRDGTIDFRLKIASLTGLWISLAASLWFLGGPLWLAAAGMAMAGAVTYHLGRLPSTRPAYVLNSRR
jgi:uncharacterized protein